MADGKIKDKQVLEGENSPDQSEKGVDLEVLMNSLNTSSSVRNEEKRSSTTLLDKEQGRILLVRDQSYFFLGDTCIIDIMNFYTSYHPSKML